ncbi:hypothetical protein PUN28_010253 [Cardiocondyla obscurior]|uniref:Uncharacterized protein n=1 Tax=Cardiocondyla obscurior TaxID=286306 RepID=A0AAW2FQ84_9HYME
MAKREKGARRASVGKRVASASTLFHPPTTLSLLLGPRGQGGQGMVRGWRAGGKRELWGRRGGHDEGREVVARLSAR